MKKHIILLLSSMLFGCTPNSEDRSQEPTESIMFYDSYMEKSFESALINNNIPFTKKYDQFWYPTKHHEKVTELEKIAIAKHTSENAFWFKDKSMFNAAKKAFIDARIPFTIIMSDNGTGLRWDKENREKARALIRKVTGIPL